MLFHILFLTASIYAQKKIEQKVSIDQLKTAVTTKDLITDLPKDCKVYSGEVSVVAANGLHSFAFMADSVGEFIRTHLPDPKKGSKIILLSLHQVASEKKQGNINWLLNEYGRK